MTAFHFLLLSAGELLKYKEEISAVDIQTFINEDPAFGARPPLEDCRLALRLLDECGFIDKNGLDTYAFRAGK
jgi:hypothetical protein